MTNRWRYKNVLTVGVGGLLTIGVGLVFAHLSNPIRFSENVRDDSAIHLYVGAALVSTLCGGILFLKAISQLVIEIPPKVRNEINLGFAAGFGTQLAAFTSSDPVVVGFGVLASLPFFCWASMRFAEAKGFPKSFGALGMLGFAGLIVLLLLPVRIEHEVARKQ